MTIVYLSKLLYIAEFTIEKNYKISKRALCLFGGKRKRESMIDEAGNFDVPSNGDRLMFARNEISSVILLRGNVLTPFFHAGY